MRGKFRCLAAFCAVVMAVSTLWTGVAWGETRSANALQPIPATLNQKMATRSGPNTRYTELGTFPQSTEIVVFQQEMGNDVPWVMVEFHGDGGLVRAYTGMKRINVNTSVPWGNTVATEALIGMDVTPRRGPGENYASCTKALSAGTKIQVYHEESGYVMADFYYPGDSLQTRAWIPLQYLSGYRSTDTVVQVTNPPQSGSAPFTNAPFLTYDAAGNSTAFVDSYGGLWMMGYNEHGEMGAGYKGTDVTSPRRIMTGVADVQLGFYFSMALDYSGNVYTWGWNKNGEIGIGDSQTQYVTSPTRIRLGNVVQIAAGDEHGVALISNGAVYTWGRNARGQLANGTTRDGYTPTQISVPGRVVSIAASDYNIAVILSDGTLWMAGDNSAGQLCKTSSQQAYTGFVQIPLDHVSQVSMGDYHVAAVTDSGSLYVWGSNQYGQVGNWQIQSATSQPQYVMSGVRQVETGDYHTLALTNSGDLYAWGRNDNGQLGDGTLSNIYSPTLVLRGVWRVDTGYAHTIVVKNDDTVWGVGRNQYGSLGLRNTGNITQWTQIAPIPQ